VKRHLYRRWAAISCTWLQSLHIPHFFHPLISSLSAVHTLIKVIMANKKIVRKCQTYLH
jgi:hypothetical protein